MTTPTHAIHNSWTPSNSECAASDELHWYAAYTCANHEKRVAQQLAERRVEQFLPLYESVRRWKDRRVRLELPLFSGYVFVRLALRDRLQVLAVPSVVNLVGFGGHAAPLADTEIETVRAATCCTTASLLDQGQTRQDSGRPAEGRRRNAGAAESVVPRGAGRGLDRASRFGRNRRCRHRTNFLSCGRNSGNSRT